MNINLTLIGQSIAFLIFVIFCMKYVWPPIAGALAERKAKIAEGLDAADQAERDLERAKEEAADLLRQKKEEAAAIIEQANKRASQIVAEAEVKADEEATRRKTAALAEIEQETSRAKEALRAQLGALVVAGAEKVLEATIDEKAHAQLVDKLATEL